MDNTITKLINTSINFVKLPLFGKNLYLSDLKGLSDDDPGIDKSVSLALSWICRAQDNSNSRDGGVASHYSIVNGWSASYPETTGYIVATLLENALIRGDADLRCRAKKMLDWLVSIQLTDGGFQGGLIDSLPVVPVTFNTGQILIGLAAGVKEFGDTYLSAMTRAADWLATSQDSDGCWRKFSSPFAAKGDKCYDTHVSWGLLEASRICCNSMYEDTAYRNISWALKQQKENGWFDKCCLTDVDRPLTHAIGYVLRGVIEGYLYFNDPVFLKAATATASGLLGTISPSGFIPGRLDSKWSGAVTWSCLTGTVQIAHCWLLLYQLTGDIMYRNAAFNANAYVRKTVIDNGNLDIVGGIRGSFPVYGGYGTNQFYNWACKFFIDSQLLEKAVRKTDNV
jgi:hypothetical protein